MALNTRYVELLDKLADIMSKQGEPFRARAYQKAQETIMTCPSDILSPSDLKGMPNIGKTILDKLTEYTNTGTLELLEREKNNPVNILAEVYGIGPKKAKELVDEGITTISKLRERQDLLNDVQKVGLQYYEDILKRIPRSEIEVYKSIFEKIFSKTAGVKMEIVGSYRRGAQTSGDIDVILTSTNPKIFVSFIDVLIKEKIILHVLSRGPSKCLVIAKIPQSSSARRVDFLFTSPEEFPFAILYFTGSKIFNTVMRHVALEKGYTMNEHGIYHMNSKVKGEKVSRVFTTEKDIFDFLELEYKSPTERTDGRSVIKIEEDDDEEIIIVNNKKIMEVGKDIEEDETYIEIAKSFAKNGISVLEKLTENELSQLLREANRAYYNKGFDLLFTDNQYDIVKEFIEAKYPSNKVVHEIGAKVEKNMVQLPYPMGSMDKIKPDTDVLSKWCASYCGPYLLSCKLDGVSGLYTTEGAEPKLYTRGDGLIGQDISHLIPYLRLTKVKGLVIRGEIIIPRALFEAKYSDKFANPRNMVAGIINHRTINSAIKDIHFVAYELIKPICKPTEQMSMFAKLDIEPVLTRVSPSITNTMLSNLLQEWRYNYAYEIDGVIVTNDAVYERKPGNPKHAFAFKMVLTDQIAEAKVVDVIWTASKDGYLKPRVQIEPINLCGVSITYATGFNGAFIRDNNVGVGAVIELIRSGDVIPHIRKVVVPALEPKMPSVAYKWNETDVDIILEDLSSDDNVLEKNISGFFRGIEVDGLSSGNVRRIMDAGFVSVPAIIKMSINDFLKVDGFKDKMATKIYEGIREKLKNASLIKIMSASNLFGRGFSEKKIELIMESYPSVLISNDPPNKKVANISSIKGMANKTAEAFVERIPEFISFMKEAGLISKLLEKKGDSVIADTSHPLYNKTIVLTGFRDVGLQEKLKSICAKVGTSVSSNTFVVLVKDIHEDTGKANDARKLGIPLMVPQEFIAKYNL